MATSEPPSKESKGSSSIYAPGTSKSSTGVRIHVGVKDVAYIATIIFGGFVWFQSRASRDDVVTVKRECVEAIASAVANVSPPLVKRLDELEKSNVKNGKRWDRLDDFVSTVKAFNQTNKTPPPKFGPRAEALGQLPRDWDQ